MLRSRRRHPASRLDLTDDKMDGLMVPLTEAMDSIRLWSYQEEEEEEEELVRSKKKKGLKKVGSGAACARGG